MSNTCVDGQDDETMLIWVMKLLLIVPATWQHVWSQMRWKLCETTRLGEEKNSWMKKHFTSVWSRLGCAPTHEMKIYLIFPLALLKELEKGEKWNFLWSSKILRSNEMFRNSSELRKARKNILTAIPDENHNDLHGRNFFLPISSSLTFNKTQINDFSWYLQV